MHRQRDCQEVVAGVRFVELGSHRLKGLPEPETIFQLLVDDLMAEFPPLRVAT